MITSKDTENVFDKRVTKNFVKNSKYAEIWTGLQGYKSDKKKKKLSSSELYKDAKAGLNGGANGTVLFRYGLTNFYLNEL